MDEITLLLQKHQHEFHRVVDHAANDKFFHFDFTTGNTGLHENDIADTAKFAKYNRRRGPASARGDPRAGPRGSSSPPS